MTVSLSVQARRGDFVLDFAFETRARIIAVEGPSGAGKTTLLHAVAGLIPVESAVVTLDGDRLVDTTAGLSPAPHQRRVGYVFQEARLFPHLSVADNVAFGRRFAKVPMTVEDALALVDLSGMGERRPVTLSGGEAQRVAIARVLCSDPRILLLDEPFSGLDAGRRATLTTHLRRLRDRTQLPMLLVSHDPRDLDGLAEDRVEMVAGRRGT